MIRASDLSAAEVQRLITTVPVWCTESRTLSAWFDDGGMAVLSVAGDINFAARGLSVEEHTTRVLEHLLAERDAPA
jgi:hypothetical protein